MTGQSEWLELAERCEKATGPDREIDAAIAAIVFTFKTGKPTFDIRNGGFVVTRSDSKPASGCGSFIGAERYTRSLDAITALIERELSGWAWRVYGRVSDRSPPQAAIGKLDQHHHDAFCGPVVVAKGATPALALNAAFCRAMAAKAGAP